ncbi:MAG: deoxyribose-phosphate aldolase [Candidatus Marinimicrobia bacterium]|nr:deoxyribose-phosphate aldolase [Candidatus Neomarinimicrobiota bacterium]MCF7903795.1 deoxyribose-phosphate aldolase [Candidatus Neomarinimicrobiota bacterium]
MNLVNKEYQKRANRTLAAWKNSDHRAGDFTEPSSAEIAAMIDHTILKPDASIAAVNKICKEALEHKFASVCVNPVHVKRCVKNLDDAIPTCTVIGFPLGANTSDIKADEARLAVKQGARELDMVINVGLMKTANFQEVFDDIKAVRMADTGVVLKVILETCLLSKDEIVIACMLCREVGADFVKTSTGFSTGGATEEDISLMRFVVKEDLRVKASGGIKTRQDALNMIKAGADRLGASAGVEIIK